MTAPTPREQLARVIDPEAFLSLNAAITSLESPLNPDLKFTRRETIEKHAIAIVDALEPRRQAAYAKADAWLNGPFMAEVRGKLIEMTGTARMHAMTVDGEFYCGEGEKEADDPAFDEADALIAALTEGRDG